MEFQLWYAYFDCLFLKKNPSPVKDFIERLEPTKEVWPADSPLDPLVDCFRSLEQFILKHENWGESICTIEELNKIQMDLSAVLNLLYIQKAYMKNFWEHQRRIEASLTHLYSILQLFIRAFIPYETMTVFECKAAKKLCIHLKNLQELANLFLKKLNMVSKYFQSSFFAEQAKILQNFFDNLITFIKTMPSIKKYQMFHVSELLKYINIINPIDACAHISRNSKTKKKVRKPKQEKKTSISTTRKNKSYEKHSVDQYFHGQIRFRCSSCHHSFQTPSNILPRKNSENQANRFQFPVWIRRYSISHRKSQMRKPSTDNYKIGKGKSNSESFRKQMQIGTPKILKKKNTQPSPTIVSSRTLTSFKSMNLGREKNIQEAGEQEQRYQIQVSPYLESLLKQQKYEKAEKLAQLFRLCISTIQSQGSQKIVEEESKIRNQIKMMLTSQEQTHFQLADLNQNF